MSYPTLVSFYCGDQYYYLAADLLRDDCRRFTDVRALKIVVDACLALGDFQRARANLSRFKPEAPEDHAYLASRKFRLGLESRADEQGLLPEDRPAVWWMETPFPGNFGDVLNPYLVEKLSGIPPLLSKQGDGILAIGSVIKFAKAGTQVWGTGTPRMTDALSPDAEYRAVRGPLTRELVLQSGGTAPELYGDAAMLLPLIYRPKIEKTHRLGLILHHVHERESLAIGDALQIPIMRIGYDQIEAFIDELCSCEAIISTSLHGLIVAHA